MLGDVEDPAEAALGVVRRAVFQLQRLHFSNDHVERNRLLAVRWSGRVLRASLALLWSTVAGGSDVGVLVLPVAAGLVDAHRGERTGVVEIATRFRQRREVERLRQRSTTSCSRTRLLVDAADAADLNVADDAPRPFSDRERHIDLTGRTDR